MEGEGKREGEGNNQFSDRINKDRGLKGTFVNQPLKALKWVSLEFTLAVF